MVCHYTYEVNGLRGLDRVADLRAALSGMSGSLNMSADSLPAGLSESLLFDGMVSRNQIIGGFYTFGHSALEGEPMFSGCISRTVPAACLYWNRT